MRPACIRAAVVRGGGHRQRRRGVLIAAGLAGVTSLILLMTLPRRVLGPIGACPSFSERFAAGDAHAKAEVLVEDEFSVIAEI